MPKLPRTFALSLPLLLAACAGAPTSPTPSTATAPEASSTAPQPVFEAQTVAEPAGGTTINDSAAAGGKALALLSNGNAARYTVPSTWAATTYTVNLRARGEQYNGAPTVAFKINGVQKATISLSGTTYATYSAGSHALKPGDALEVVFTNDLNGGSGKDRNAIIDHFDLTAAGTTSTPAPAPAPAPTPTPTTGGTDVRSFGAKGDGVTDDTNALQNALNSGQNLNFPSGTYLISRPLTLTRSNVTLTSSGATLKAKTGLAGIALLHLRQVSGVTARGFTLVGAATSGAWIDGIRVTGGSGAVIDGNTVRNVSGAGITSEQASATTISNNIVSQTGFHGIWGDKASNQKWLNNKVSGQGAGRLTASIGLLGTLGSGPYLIQGNTATGYGNTAMKTEGISDVTFQGNTVDGFARDAVKIMPYPEGGVTQVSNGVLDGNTVRGYTGADSLGSSALQLSSVIGGRVTNNTAYGMQGDSPNGYEDGIRLQAHGSGPVTSGITISGNKIYDHMVGIRIQGNKNTIQNNTFQNNSQHGVIFNRNASGNSFTGNTFIGAAQLGVLFDLDVNNTTFSGNSFSGMSNAIYAANSGNNYNTFRTNTFASGVTRAISFAGTGNVCSGNTGSGVSSNCQ